MINSVVTIGGPALCKTKQITREEEKWEEMHDNVKVDCFMMVVIVVLKCSLCSSFSLRNKHCFSNEKVKITGLIILSITIVWERLMFSYALFDLLLKHIISFYHLNVLQ